MKQLTLAILLMLMSLNALYAQPRTIGAAVSFSGISVQYQHDMSTDSFSEIVLKSEMSRVFEGSMKYPGMTLSYIWNFIFATRKLSDGSIISFYAGPGATAGYTPDTSSRHGAMFGLRGQLGVECHFTRGITISAGICPAIGSHLLFNEDSMNVSCYISGLTYDLIPEVGFRYAV